MVRPDISAVVPMEMRIVVVEKLRCSSVTMTAAVEPLTMPQMSRGDLIGHVQQPNGLPTAFFPVSRHGMKGLRIRRRDGHADHIEHDAQRDENSQNQNGDPYTAVLQRRR